MTDKPIATYIFLSEYSSDTTSKPFTFSTFTFVHACIWVKIWLSYENEYLIKNEIIKNNG